MPRSIWKGTIGFGLVSIAIELLPAEMPERLDLDLLDRRDNARVGYQKYNKTTGKIVPTSEVVRGFATGENQYVILSDDDLKAANPKATQSIDILGFLPDDAISRIYFAKPYYVSPLKGSDRAYTLLRDALEEQQQLGLAQVVIHTRQHLAAVYPHDQALVVQLLRYEADLRSPGDAGVTLPPAARRPASKEMAMAEQLITSMAMKWKPSDFTDTYRADVMKLVKQREKKGGKSSPPPAKATEQEPRVLDLVAALSRSLAAGGKRAAPQGKRAAKARKGRVA